MVLLVTINDEPIQSSGALSVLYGAVDELIRRYGGSDDGHDLRLDELGPPLGLFLVARYETHPVGGVGLRSISGPDSRIGEIKRLWVRPDLRRGGVANKLMQAVEDRARQLGYRQLYLETGVAQPEALAFYPKTGWIATPSFPLDAFTHEQSSRFTKAL